MTYWIHHWEEEVGEGEGVEQRHLQQEEEVGVQRRKPSIC